MSETVNRQSPVKPQTIVLKQGCWVKTSTGLRRMRQKVKTEAIPILSDGEVVGFRFHSFLYQGVSHDLEKIIVGSESEK